LSLPTGQYEANSQSHLNAIVQALIDMQPPNRSAVPRASLLWRILHWPVWLFTKLWLRVTCSGRENIDNTRGGLFLINHQSYLDPLLAALLLRRPVSYLARDSLFRVPVLGWVLRRTHVIPISREAVRSGSIRQALESLEEGFLVGIFPEGTRSSNSELLPFRPGFTALMRRTHQPVYPVGVSGSRRALPRGAWFIRPARIHITYGKPFTSEERQQLETGNDAAFCELARQRVAECIRKIE